jgi:kynurenine formamidase
MRVRSSLNIGLAMATAAMASMAAVAMTAAVATAAAGCGGGTPPERSASAAGAAAGAAGPRGRLVDLTHAFDERTLYWPSPPDSFVLQQLSHGQTAGGYFYAANKLCAPEHGGTHLDAPLHFSEKGASSADIPLERLVGPAVVIDMTAAAAQNPDALLGAADVAAFEAQHGAIAPGTIVLVRTGWADRWPDRKRYLGDDRPGDASNLHFPGVGEDAARALVARKIGALGIDTASIDRGPSKDFITHQVLMGADIPAFENVASMKDLPTRGATIIALPMKIAGGSGGPLRIVAMLPP